MAYPVGGEYHTSHGITLSAFLLACFEGILMAKQEKMVRLAKAMGEPVDGLAPREAAFRALEAIRHLLKSVDLPVSLGDLDITDKTQNPDWAVEAHKEQRLLSRSPRILSVKDIEKIYEKGVLRTKVRWIQKAGRGRHSPLPAFFGVPPIRLPPILFPPSPFLNPQLQLSFSETR